MKRLLLAIILLTSVTTAYSNTAVVGSMWKQVGPVLFPADDVTEINYEGISTSELANVNVVAELPASPQQGAFYLYSGVGRKVLYERVDSDWETVRSYGDMTLYVDGASGTDIVNCGTATGASACDTIQYAVDQIPSSVGGDVTVNIGNGTYSEDVIIQGKTYTGPYSITLQGSMVQLDSLSAGVGSVQGASATRGTVVRGAGTWTSNQRQNKFARFTSGAESGTTRLIDSNTTTTLTIVSTWGSAPAQNDTFIVEEPGAIIQTLALGIGQGGIFVNDIELNYNATTTVGGDRSSITFTRCSIEDDGTNRLLTFNIATNALFDTCYFNGVRIGNVGGTNRVIRSKAFEGQVRCFHYTSGFGSIEWGTVIDGNSKTAQRGVWNINSRVLMQNSITEGYCFLRDLQTAIEALETATVVGTTNNQYSGNDTDENAVAASYGYID